MQYTYDVDSFSDLHKDARGFRPSEGYYEWLETATPDQLQAEWDSLYLAFENSVNEEEQLKAAALELLIAHIDNITKNNNVDVKTCIRWMHDAEGTNGDNEYLDYKLGVKYGTIDNILQQVK